MKKNEVINLTFASSLTDLCSANSSFDSGILQIAYTGENRNKSYIDKETFERCLPSMYNCPIVCNYDRETDSLGGHDMELVHDNTGSLRIVNLTEPVGVIPSGAKHFWKMVEEEDGTEHEYLCVEALIWKRQEAYRKIKKDGITAQSMEMTIKDGRRIDGIYHITDFEFTAFALLGVEPCYESAALTFAKQDFKKQLSEMMQDLKESFSKIDSSVEDFDTNDNSMKGGEEDLGKKELIKKYNIDVDALDFSIEDFSVEELEAKFQAMTEAAQADEPEQKADEPKDEPENFALTSDVMNEMLASLSSQKVTTEYGECNRYCFVDCDFENSEVYCWDTQDWLLYGFKFAKNGDKVEIDFESKTRKKYSIVDFDEGEQASPFAETYSMMNQKIQDSASEFSAMEEKFNEASKKMSEMETELNELRQFKLDAETTAAVNERTAQNEEVFAQFGDLEGVEAFEELKAECDEDCMKFELDALEEKCFAIRGRQGVKLQFSAQKPQKIKIDKDENNKEPLPYGGIFEKYGFSLDE